MAWPAMTPHGVGLEKDGTLAVGSRLAEVHFGQVQLTAKRKQDSRLDKGEPQYVVCVYEIDNILSSLFYFVE